MTRAAILLSLVVIQVSNATDGARRHADALADFARV